MAANVTLRMKLAIKIASGAAGAIGVPRAFAAHGDVVVIAGIWTLLLVDLAEQAGQQLEKAKAAKIVAVVLGGVSAFKVGFKAANTYFAYFAYTGAGTLPAMAANAGVNAGVTYIFGNASARVLLSDSIDDAAQTIALSILGFMGSALGIGTSGAPRA